MNTLLRTLAATATVAAAAAPTALADRWYAGETPRAVDLRSPDTREAAEAGSYVGGQKADAHERGRSNSPMTGQAAGPQSTDSEAAAMSQEPAAVATPAGGFAWGAAGIGAGFVVGLVLLGFTGLAFARYRQPTGA